MTDTPKVRNVVVKMVFDDLGQAGIAAEPLLNKAGLQPYQINRDDGWVPFESHASFLESASQELDDPCYSLKLARRIDPRDFGALGYVGLSSRTFHDALLNLERYLLVVTEAWKIKLVMEKRTVIIQQIPSQNSFYHHPQAVELTAGILVNMYQFFIAQTLAPIEVQFVHALPSASELARCEELLGCRVRFGQQHCRVVLDRKSLLLPISSADDRLLKILLAYCEQVIQQHKTANATLIGSIRRKIIDLLPSGRAKAKLVACELGLTERTMHRRLAEQGTSFSELHESLRRELAKKYLRDHALTLQQIAFLLGYSDQSAFSVAFRRWTGQSPKQARMN